MGFAGFEVTILGVLIVQVRNDVGKVVVGQKQGHH